MSSRMVFEELLASQSLRKELSKVGNLSTLEIEREPIPRGVDAEAARIVRGFRRGSGGLSIGECDDARRVKTSVVPRTDAPGKNTERPVSVVGV